MEHREHIDHAFIIAPLTLRWTGVPEHLQVLTLQFLVVQGDSAYCIGTGHADGIVAGRIRAIDLKLTVLKTFISEEGEQAPHGLAL